jgi:hypothetical protein
MKWAGNVERMGEVRKIHEILLGNIEGKRPFARKGHRWEVTRISEKYVVTMWTEFVWLRI